MGKRVSYLVVKFEYWVEEFLSVARYQCLFERDNKQKLLSKYNDVISNCRNKKDKDVAKRIYEDAIKSITW